MVSPRHSILSLALSIQISAQTQFHRPAAIVFLLLIAALSVPFSAAHAHRFDFHLIATTAEPSLDSWFHTPPDSTPVLPAADHLYKYQPFHLVVIFQGFHLNNKEEANVTYDVSVFDPEGQRVFHETGLSGIEGNVSPDAPFCLAKQRLTLVFDTDDPFGPYRIEILARDVYGNQLRKRSVHTNLHPFGYASPPDSIQEFRQWLPTYYLQPDPARALLALLHYAEFENPVSGQLNFSQLTFFQTLINQHPFLLDALVAAYPDSPEHVRFRILFMLAYANYREPSFLKNLPEAEFAFYEGIRLFFPPDPYDPIISAQQLDMLWAEFYATGRLRPIRQIITALDLASFEGSLRELNNRATDEEREESIRRSAMREMIFPSAQWTLINNCRQHHLVRAYCIQLLNNGDLSSSEREQLRNVLSAADSSPSHLGDRRDPRLLQTPLRTISP